MNRERSKPEIWSIDRLLKADLQIPSYQRPYKWTNKNITELLLDIQKSIEESRKYAGFKYRVGTVILYKNDDNKYEIVDGQQRVLSFLLLSPESKRKTYEKMISKGSLKLRRMSEIFDTDNCTSETWTQRKCQEHEQEMLKLLQNF